MPNTRNVDRPPDINEIRRELRRAYTEVLELIHLTRRMRREMDASTSDPGRRLALRKHTSDYVMALDDISEASNRIFVFSAMLGAEFEMRDQAVRIFEQRRRSRGESS